MGTTRNRRAAVKKYTKLAHTSVLAISMGLSMGPVSMQAAGEADPQSVQPEVLPTAYSSPQVYQGDSMSYFKDQFLGKSSFRALGSGEEAPAAINVGINGFAQVGKVLTGTYTYTDADGDNEDGSIFTWFRADDNNGTNISPIAGAILETYTLTNDDLGKYITFQVKPQNLAVNGNAGLPVQSGPTAAIAVAAAAPTATNVAVSGFAQVGKELTGTYTYGDVNGEPELGSRYKWYRSDDAAGTNKTAITGATGKKYVLTGDDLGQFIIFEVQPRNEFEDGIGELAASEPTAAIAVAAAAPTATNVAVSGFAQVGKELTGTYTYDDVNGEPELGSRYQWYRSDDAAGTNKTAITGATGKKYVLTGDDLGKYIIFEVQPRNEFEDGIGELAASEPTVAIAVAAAAPTATNVAVSGFAQVGKELTGTYTYGDVNGEPELGSRYKWYRSDDAAGTNKTAITGATGKKYVLTGDDLGKYIIFEVQPRNEFEDGIGELAASEPTAAIAVAAAAPTAINVTVSGFAQVGKELTGTYTYDDVNGEPELGSRYQWYRLDDAAGTNKTAITGATGTKYVLTGDDLGKYIIFEVQPRNEFEDGIGELAASEPTAAIAVAAAAPTATNVA
ncbi:hypothetical protein GC101_12705, partial [Paenibacillus sp. LMG 31459]|nr:hypothetical protein [Paenibacillus phytohabitans]